MAAQPDPRLLKDIWSYLTSVIFLSLRFFACYSSTFTFAITTAVEEVRSPLLLSDPIVDMLANAARDSKRHYHFLFRYFCGEWARKKQNITPAFLKEFFRS